MVADVDQRRVMGFFSPAMLKDREFFRWTFPDCATYVLLVHHWLTPVHASCVVRDGYGICLSGPSGAGKTSLAFACARAGYRLLTEDVVYLNRSGNSAALLGNPTHLHFLVSARELFPELKQARITMSRERQECLVVRTEEWLPGRAVTEAKPGVVVFLERSSGAAPVLETVPAAEARRLLFEALLLDHEQTMAAHQEALRCFVEAGAYRLRYSNWEQALEQLDGLPLPRRTVE